MPLSRSLCLAALIVLPIAAHAQNSGYELLDEVIRKISEECNRMSADEYLNCKAEYTPEKCKDLVYATDTRAWARCIYSCGNASTYSKAFGACSD